MPELARFYGIVVRIFFADHPPPHIHVSYGPHEALISIRDLSVLSGTLPPRALGLVIEWAHLHHAEIWQAWERASAHENPGRIEPLP